MPALRCLFFKRAFFGLLLMTAATLPAQTIPDLEKLAATGDAGAEFQLGILYAAGQGVPFDIDRALQWYRKAAEKGYGEAEYNLAVAYHNGLGVTKDDEGLYDRVLSLLSKRG